MRQVTLGVDTGDWKTWVQQSLRMIEDNSNLDVPGVFGLDLGGAETAGDAQVLLQQFAQWYIADVDFTVANTDFPIDVVPPTGFTRFRVSRVVLSEATGSLVAATAGLFTLGGGGGVQIVTGGSAITVSTGAENTNNNMQLLTVNNVNTQNFDVDILYFRVGAATPQQAKLALTLEWVS